MNKGEISGKLIDCCEAPYCLPMDRLPLELLEIIYFYANNPHLSFINTKFYAIQDNPMIQTKALLMKYGLWFPSCQIYDYQPKGTANQWIDLITDKKFKPEFAKILLQLKYHSDVFFDIIIEFASIHGAVSLVDAILKRQPKRSVKSLSRALVQSSMYGHVELMELLYRAGAQVDFDNDAAICMAAKMGHQEALVWCLDHGANLHANEDYPLCWACRQGYFSLVQILVNNGANVNSRNGRPFQWACEFGHDKIVRYLLEQGVDVRSNQDYGLRWASARGNLKTVQVLIEYHADIHASDDFALRHATKMEHLAVVRLLLENGANPIAHDYEAIKWTTLYGSPEMKSLYQAFREKSAPTSPITPFNPHQLEG